MIYVHTNTRSFWVQSWKWVTTKVYAERTCIASFTKQCTSLSRAEGHGKLMNIFRQVKRLPCSEEENSKKPPGELLKLQRANEKWRCHAPPSVNDEYIRNVCVCQNVYVLFVAMVVHDYSSMTNYYQHCCEISLFLLSFGELLKNQHIFFEILFEYEKRYNVIEHHIIHLCLKGITLTRIVTQLMKKLPRSFLIIIFRRSH